MLDDMRVNSISESGFSIDITNRASRTKARAYLEDSSTALTRALGRPAARNEISTSRPDDVAVVQALELLNGEDYNHAVYGAEILQKLDGRAPEAVVDTLYWAALDRAPTKKELALSVDFLKQGSPPGDMLWALFSSPEFQYIR